MHTTTFNPLVITASSTPPGPPSLALKVTSEILSNGDLQVIVADETTSVYGVGSTLSAAVSEYESALGEFRHVLLEQPKLAKHLQQMLKDIDKALGILGNA